MGTRPEVCGASRVASNRSFANAAAARRPACHARRSCRSAFQWCPGASRHAAQLAVSLFSGGRDWEAVKAARANLTTRILDERSVRQQLLFEVTQAWYRIHEAEAQVQVSSDQLKASERQLEDAQERLREKL